MSTALATKQPDEISNAETVPIVQPDSDPMLAMIERVILNPDLPMERLEKMLDLRERQMAKEAEQEFNRSFAAAMAEMPTVKKSGKNNHTGNRYSTLDDLINAARPALSAHGLSLNWQKKTGEGGLIEITAFVRHASGHSISTTDSAPADTGKQMNVLQGGGSTQTYLKRYTGFAILGMSSGDEKDDDGNGSVKTINAAQYQDLTALIEEKGGDADAFLAFIKAKGCKTDTLQEIPAADYPAIMDTLRAKKATA